MSAEIVELYHPESGTVAARTTNSEAYMQDCGASRGFRTWIQNDEFKTADLEPQNQTCEIRTVNSELRVQHGDHAETMKPELKPLNREARTANSER